jgi:hypothetical protein
LDYSKGGVWIKTYSGMAETKEGPFHTFMIGGEKKITQQRPLHEATEEIYELAHASEASDDPVMKNVRAFLAELDILPHPEYTYRSGEQRREIITSHRARAALLKARAAAARNEEPVTFMEIDINRKDFVELVSYVMTNTLLHSEKWGGEGEDPRVAMLDQFRSVA